MARVRHYLADGARAFRRAPVEVLLALIVAAAFSFALAREGGDALRDWAAVAIVGILVGTVAWTGTLLHALGDWSERRRWIGTATGLALGLLYGTIVLRLELAGEAWRAGALLGAAVFWLAAAPVLAGSRGEASARVRRIDARIFLRTAGAGVCAAAFFVGLVLALTAVQSLFELRLDEQIYGHAFGWLAFAAVPWIVFGGLPDYVRPLGREDRVAAALHRLAAYVVFPLLVVYYAILFAYAVRVLVLGELPANLVSPLVLAAGGLTALAAVLFDPAPSGSATARVLRLLPALFLPLAGLGFWALALRVGDYGWTEFRYLRFGVLVAFTVLAVGALIRVARGRRLGVHAIPVVLAGVLLLSAVGPWSATAVSRRSQLERLETGLARAGLLRDGRAVAVENESGREVPPETYEQIASTARYLDRHFGRAVLLPLVPAAEGYDPVIGDLAAHLGLRSTGPIPAAPRRPLLARLEPGTPIDDMVAGRIYRITLPEPPPVPGPGPPGGAEDTGAPGEQPAGGGAQAVITAEGTRLRVQLGDAPLFVDLRPLAEWMRSSRADIGRPTSLPAERAVLPALDEAGRARGRLLVLEAAFEGENDGLAVVRLDGLLGTEAATES